MEQSKSQTVSAPAVSVDATAACGALTELVGMGRHILNAMELDVEECWSWEVQASRTLWQVFGGPTEFSQRFDGAASEAATMDEWEDLKREELRERLEILDECIADLRLRLRTGPQRAHVDTMQLFDALVGDPDLRAVTRQRFCDGHYSDAVLEAYKHVNNYVKRASGLVGEDGSGLMGLRSPRRTPDCA